MSHKLLLYCLLLPCLLIGNQPGRILYMAKQGKIQEAIDIYNAYKIQKGSHDAPLLQQLCQIILDEGYHSPDDKIQFLALFGAGLSANEKLLYIPIAGLENPKMEIQAAALHFLGKLQTNEMDMYLRKAMSSNYLMVRLEAAAFMADTQNKAAMGQIESLMCKMPRELHVIFPEFYAKLGDPRATKFLKKFLAEGSLPLRLQTLLCITKERRDDLLPQIRSLACTVHPTEQEAIAFALGSFHDVQSEPELFRFLAASVPSTRLSTLKALHEMGNVEARQKIIAMAEGGDIFAIFALGEIEQTESILKKLCKSPDSQVRLNATLALLQRKNPECLAGLYDILLANKDDVIFAKVTSPAKTLSAWKVISPFSFPEDVRPLAEASSLALQQQMLVCALELSDKIFYDVATTVFDKEKKALIPALIQLLENKKSEECLQLLWRNMEKPGSPLIRNYASLSLYRLGEKGPFETKIKEWILQEKQQDLLRQSDLTPCKIPENPSSYQLTSEETARFFIDAVETFTEKQDACAIDLLVDLIRNGNPKNRYIFSGLLMRAVL